jgi:hypothetical protein
MVGTPRSVAEFTLYSLSRVWVHLYLYGLLRQELDPLAGYLCNI